MAIAWTDDTRAHLRKIAENPLEATGWLTLADRLQESDDAGSREAAESIRAAGTLMQASTQNHMATLRHALPNARNTHGKDTPFEKLMLQAQQALLPVYAGDATAKNPYDDITFKVTDPKDWAWHKNWCIWPYPECHITDWSSRADIEKICAEVPIANLHIHLNDHSLSTTIAQVRLDGLLPLFGRVNTLTLHVQDHSRLAERLDPLLQRIAEHGKELTNLRQVNVACPRFSHGTHKAAICRSMVKWLAHNENLPQLESIGYQDYWSAQDGQHHARLYGTHIHAINHIAHTSNLNLPSAEKPFPATPDCPEVENSTWDDQKNMLSIISDRQSMLGQERLVPRTLGGKIGKLLGMRWHHPPGENEQQSLQPHTQRLLDGYENRDDLGRQ